MGVAARLKERHEPGPKVGGALRWDSRITFHARSVPEGIAALGPLPSLPVARNTCGESLTEERTDQRGWPRRTTHGVEPAEEAFRHQLERQSPQRCAKQCNGEGGSSGEEPTCEQRHADGEGNQQWAWLNHAVRWGRAMRAPATNVSPS